MVNEGGEHLPYDPVALGSMIRRRREARGWTQIELAKMLERSNSYLSQLEKGRPVDISLSFLDSVRRAFGIPLLQVLIEGGVELNGGSSAVPGDLELDIERLRAATPNLTLSQLRVLIATAEAMERENMRDREASGAQVNRPVIVEITPDEPTDSAEAEPDG